MSGQTRRRTAWLPSRLTLAGAVVTALLLHAAHTEAQSTVMDTTIQKRIAALEVPELGFDPPSPRLEEIHGVPVYFLEDPDLPLVTLYATFKGGYSRLPRAYYGAANALPALLRNGGTLSLPPDSVDQRMEYYALSTSFGQNGGSVTSSLNSLTENLGPAVALWSDMLRNPRFDTAQVQVWRGGEVERANRRRDNPASLAFARFNEIMFGDHPVGWTLSEGDVDEADLSEARLRFVHQAIVCPDDMVIGVVGDLSWDEVEDLVTRLLAGWPACSGGLLAEEPVPDLRQSPGVFVIQKEIDQAVVVMAHASKLRQSETPQYFASRIGNSILGASGFSSRLTTEVRTRAGLAYSASSLWTISRKRDGLIGALTRTKPESALSATRLILSEMDRIRTEVPGTAELSLAVDEVVNGFVFNFQTPMQMVSRQIAYRNLELPSDWLYRYLAGVQSVEPQDVTDVFSKQLDPSRMTILIVGDTTRFDGSPSDLGHPVTLLEEGSSPSSSPPRESPRSRR